MKNDSVRGAEMEIEDKVSMHSSPSGIPYLLHPQNEWSEVRYQKSEVNAVLFQAFIFLPSIMLAVVPGRLQVSNNYRYLQYENGKEGETFLTPVSSVAASLPTAHALG
jgi:hypothetical protein